MSNKKIIVILLAAIPGIIWSGFVIKILWIWFMVPLGIIEISLAHAIGIDIIITFLVSPSFDIENKTTTELISKMISKPATMLFMGFIAKGFM